MLYLILAFGAAGGAALLWKRGDRFSIVVLVVVALGARLALLGSAPFFPWMRTATCGMRN